MKSLLSVSVVSVLFVCNAIEAIQISGENHLSIVKRSAERTTASAYRFQAVFHKLAVAAADAKFVYFGVLMRHFEENILKFKDVVLRNPGGPSVQGLTEFANVHSDMLKDIVAELRVQIVEKGRMTSAQFDQWYAKWTSIKAVTTISLLTFFGNASKSRVFFMMAEVFLMTIIALVEDFQTADNALSTIESLVPIIAELVMN